MAWRAITLVVMGALVLGACGAAMTKTRQGTIVYAVGDAADGGGDATALASYIEKQDLDRFFYLGDVYETGTAEEFERNYDPLYGDLADRTDPVIGNHEYPNGRMATTPTGRASVGGRRRRRSIALTSIRTRAGR